MKKTTVLIIALLAACLAVCIVSINLAENGGISITVQSTPTPTPVPTPKPTPRPTPMPTQSTAPSATRTTVPYVGMHVSSIPYKWTWQGTDNLTVTDQSGNKVKTVKYRYDVSPKSYSIWVDEYDRVVKVTVSDPTATSKTKKKSSYSSSSSLDTSGFVHEEDFYEWYRDDFYDYEEAEDYYKSHGGK